MRKCPPPFLKMAGERVPLAEGRVGRGLSRQLLCGRRQGFPPDATWQHSGGAGLSVCHTKKWRIRDCSHPCSAVTWKEWRNVCVKTGPNIATEDFVSDDRRISRRRATTVDGCHDKDSDSVPMFACITRSYLCAHVNYIHVPISTYAAIYILCYPEYKTFSGIATHSDLTSGSFF